MLDLFIEMTNNVFWDGYAEQLSVENPEIYKLRLKRFAKYYMQGHNDTSLSEGCFMAILQKNYDRNIKSQLKLR